MTVPVAFLVFNRPDCTARVFARIREARPPRLLVVADGPRPDRPDDAQRCAEVRRLIDDGVDWPCVVERNYAEGNLGCALRISSGLDWAFSRAERLIVLEDDCLPDLSFFRFCEEMLERYATDERIGQVCGCTRYFSRVDRAESYLFSRYGPIWGWASWSRAWRHYDLQMKNWPEVRASGKLRKVVQSQAEYEIRLALYNQLHEKRPTTWDYQWGYTKLTKELLSIMPAVNLIENLGFSGEQTHGQATASFELKTGSVDFPLRHPPTVKADGEFDQAYSKAFVSPQRGLRAWLRNWKHRASKILSYATR